jgi:hypothetical protein
MKIHRLAAGFNSNIEFRSELPTSATGKVLRTDL